MTEVGGKACPKVLREKNVWAIWGTEEGRIGLECCKQRRMKIFAGAMSQIAFLTMVKSLDFVRTNPVFPLMAF